MAKSASSKQGFRKEACHGWQCAASLAGQSSGLAWLEGWTPIGDQRSLGWLGFLSVATRLWSRCSLGVPTHSLFFFQWDDQGVHGKTSAHWLGLCHSNTSIPKQGEAFDGLGWGLGIGGGRLDTTAAMASLFQLGMKKSIWRFKWCFLMYICRPKERRYIRYVDY